MAKTVLGFDIGSFSIKIIKYNGSVIQKAANVELPEKLVESGRIADFDSMADFIRSVLKKNKISASKAAVILPSSLAILRRFEMPLMTVDQLELNLPYEFHDFLDLDKDEYFYDYVFNYKISTPAPSEGGLPLPEKMDITAAAVPKSVINSYREMFKRAGLRLVTAVPKECAYANLLRRVNVPEDYECCFIDLGYERTDVDIFEGVVFQSGRSNDVAMSLLTDNPEAVYTAISADIRKSLNFYRFSNRDSELEIAYCFGGGFMLPGLMNAIHQTTAFNLKDIRELLPPFSEKIACQGAFALAVGAALQ